MSVHFDHICIIYRDIQNNHCSLLIVHTSQIQQLTAVILMLFVAWTAKTSGFCSRYASYWRKQRKKATTTTTKEEKMKQTKNVAFAACSKFVTNTRIHVYVCREEGSGTGKGWKGVLLLFGRKQAFRQERQLLACMISLELAGHEQFSITKLTLLGWK